MNNFNYVKSDTSGKNFGIFLMFSSTILAFIPSLFSWDMMRWGYGTVTICIFIFIMGFVTYKMYKYRLKQILEIIEGKEILAHWHYPETEFANKIEKTFKESRDANLIMYKIVLFFSVLFTSIFIGIGFSSGEGDSMGLFFVIMMSALAVISFAAYYAPIYERRKSLSANSEVIIGKRGMIHLGKLHTWGTLLFVLHNVSIDENTNELVFKIKYFTRVGWYKYEMYVSRIDIPKGKQEEAKSVVKTLMKVL